MSKSSLNKHINEIEVNKPGISPEALSKYLRDYILNGKIKNNGTKFVNILRKYGYKSVDKMEDFFNNLSPKDRLNLKIDVNNLNEIKVNKPDVPFLSSEVRSFIKNEVVSYIVENLKYYADDILQYYFEEYDIFKPFIIDQMILNNHEILKNGQEILVSHNNEDLIEEKDIKEYIESNPALKQYLNTLIIKFYEQNLDINCIYNKVIKNTETLIKKGHLEIEDILKRSYYVESKMPDMIDNSIDEGCDSYYLDDVIQYNDDFAPYLIKEFSKTDRIDEIEVNKPGRRAKLTTGNEDEVIILKANVPYEKAKNEIDNDVTFFDRDKSEVIWNLVRFPDGEEHWWNSEELEYINEIKVNKPNEKYYFNPFFDKWLNQDYYDARYEFGEDTADCIFMFKMASPNNKTLTKQDVKKMYDEHPEGWESTDVDGFIDFLLEYNVILPNKPINEIKVNKPVPFIKDKEYWVDVYGTGNWEKLSYGTKFKNENGREIYTFNNEKTGERIGISADKIKGRIKTIKSLDKTKINKPMKENKIQSFAEKFIESFVNEVKEMLLREYPESKIAQILNKWEIDPNPNSKDERAVEARKLIKRFEEIKGSLDKKIDIIVIPDEIKNKDIKNIDLYSFDDLQKLINSYPENPEKVKKDAVEKFVKKEQIDKATAQSYVARFANNKEKLKLGTKEGLEDLGLTKEEVLSFIPKRLQQRDAFLDPRNWNWAPFEQMLDALFPSQKKAEAGEENLAETDADKVYDKDGIEIYRGDDIRKCISYNPILTDTGRKKYGWCVTQTNNPQYDYYRFGDKAPTFYFVFDRNKPSTPNHSPFDDKWHAFVIRVTNDSKKYIVTDATNPPDKVADGWENVSKIVPADTWAKIKNLKDYFKPIPLSKTELARKFASGKNLSLDEFKELSQDEKMLYVKGKGFKNQLSKEILDILPKYKIQDEGKTTTLANIAIDSGQEFPYSALKDNEALAKRYAIFRFRHTDYGKKPIPLPFIKYLDDDAKQKYLDKYPGYSTFEYLEKYFGKEITEKYVEQQLKNLDYLPPTAIKYIKDPKLKKLFEIYSKLFTSWQYGSQTNISDEELENSNTMPIQDINPVPLNLKQWLSIPITERNTINILANKFNSNPKYSTLLYALPYFIKDRDKEYALVPISTDNMDYDSWALVDKQGKIIKNNISGNSILKGEYLQSIYPEKSNNFSKVYDIRDLKIEE